jgi:hypothetical protein
MRYLVHPAVQAPGHPDGYGKQRHRPGMDPDPHGVAVVAGRPGQAERVAPGHPQRPDHDHPPALGGHRIVHRRVEPGPQPEQRHRDGSRAADVVRDQRGGP